MGNKLVGRHGLHICPLQPPKMIFYSQPFFKQPPQFHRPQVYIPQPMIYLLKTYAQPRAGRRDCYPLVAPPDPVVYVKVTGENLGSVERVLYQGTALKTKNVSDDGKTMELLVTKEMSATKGRRSIDFASKDGTTEVTADLIVRP